MLSHDHVVALHSGGSLSQFSINILGLFENSHVSYIAIFYV